MNVAQHKHLSARRRWPWVVAVGLLAGALTVTGLRIHAATQNQAPPQPDKKDAPPAKQDKDAPPAARPAQDGQIELLEEMLKTLKNPGGPTTDDLERILLKAMQNPNLLTMPNQFGKPLVPGGFDAGQQNYVRGRLGLRIEPASEVLAEQLNLPAGQGQIILQVFPDSTAGALKPSDILLQLDGKPVSRNPADFVTALQGIKPDTPVDAVVLRKGVKTEVKGLTLRQAPPPLPAPPGQQPGLPQLNGLQQQFPGMGQGPGWQAGPGGKFGPRGGFKPGGPLGPMAGGPGQLNAQGNFNISSQEPGLDITVVGVVNNGVVTVTGVTIQDNGVTLQFISIDQVPPQYRDRVNALVDKTAKARGLLGVQGP
jgi:hypothetical protein